MPVDSDVIDCLIVGAGVIGLAIARELAQAGLTVIVAEQERAIGTGISARSSEVIHAGIYYPRGSLKARLCKEGNSRLYAYCRDRNVDHRRCGKLIVATTPSQLSALESLAAAAQENGIALQWLDGAAAKRLEPELQCAAALLSPTTGIVDTRQLMLALLADAEHAGATLALDTRITHAQRDRNSFALFIDGDTEPALRTRWLINSAGLGAIALAHCITPRPMNIPPQYFAKGSYFALQGVSPFSRLIYPLPEPGGLGIHLTLDIGGQARFGPDVEWIAEPDYRVEWARADAFYAAIRRYWPPLRDGQLIPAYAGIRPKISAAAMPSADFRIDPPAHHGVPGLINLFGIESPGITSALALATHVRKLIETGPEA